MNKAIAITAMLAAAAGCSTEQPVAATSLSVVEGSESTVAETVYSSQVNTVTTGTVAAKVDHVAYKQVVLDGFQSQALVVEDVRRSKTNDGYDRVEVLLKNMTNAPLRTRYRFDWQDANGVLRHDLGQDAWEKVTIAAGDNAKFSSIAPRKDCADFRLRMKSIQ